MHWPILTLGLNRPERTALQPEGAAGLPCQYIRLKVVQVIFGFHVTPARRVDNNEHFIGSRVLHHEKGIAQPVQLVKLDISHTVRVSYGI